MLKLIIVLDLQKWYKSFTTVHQSLHEGPMCTYM